MCHHSHLSPHPISPTCPGPTEIQFHKKTYCTPVVHWISDRYLTPVDIGDEITSNSTTKHALVTLLLHMLSHDDGKTKMMNSLHSCSNIKDVSHILNRLMAKGQERRVERKEMETLRRRDRCDWDTWIETEQQKLKAHQSRVSQELEKETIRRTQELEEEAAWGKQYTSTTGTAAWKKRSFTDLAADPDDEKIIKQDARPAKRQCLFNVYTTPSAPPAEKSTTLRPVKRASQNPLAPPIKRIGRTSLMDKALFKDPLWDLLGPGE